MIKIITDTASDLPIELAKQQGIIVVPLKVNFEGQEYLDRYTLEVNDFYNKLAHCETLPTTSQPSPNDFLKHIEKAKENNDEVIMILLSSQLSGTYQSAMLAKEMSGYDKVYVIDSLQATLGLQFLVNEAVCLKNSGNSVEKIVEAIEVLKHQVKVIGVVDTLEYLVKGGRLSKTSGIAGNLLKIKPILTLKEGKIEVLSKARGMCKATNETAKIISESGGIDLDYPVYIGYTGSDEGNEKFVCILQGECCFKEYQSYIVGSTIGTHIGPGAKVIVYKSK